jgi:hypothetical protein
MEGSKKVQLGARKLRSICINFPQSALLNAVYTQSIEPSDMSFEFYALCIEILNVLEKLSFEISVNEKVHKAILLSQAAG